MPALTAVRAGRSAANPVIADLSAMEVMVGTLPYPMLLHETFMRLGFPIGEERLATIPGIVRCADGWVGINALTGQHFQDICAMLDAAEFAPRQQEIVVGRPTARRLLRQGPALARRPHRRRDRRSGPGVPHPGRAGGRRREAPPLPAARRARVLDHRARRATSCSPVRRGGSGATPGRGPPARADARPGRRDRRPAFHAPRLPESPAVDRTDPALPFAGLKVVDLGTFWAGPYVAMYLGAFGADVVKVESIQRPDGFRFSGAFPQEGDDWYDRGGVWQGTNLDKRDVTLDATREDGQRLLRLLIAQADVVIENFSARVIEQFGLDYEAIRRLKRDVVMLRMPGFGLEGPWRDYVGWAMGIEQASGMAQVTGYPDKPMHPGGFADPMIAMHAAVALQAALEHRDRTGEGQMIEVAQLETACCLTADQPMDFQLNGRIATRDRQPRPAHGAPGRVPLRRRRLGRAQRPQRRRLAQPPRRARPAAVGDRRLRHRGRPGRRTTTTSTSSSASGSRAGRPATR